MTQLIAWWQGLDALGKAIRAAIVLLSMGVGLGFGLLRHRVEEHGRQLTAHEQKLELAEEKIRRLETTLDLQNAKLDRIICYQEETASERPNFARCAR